MEMTAVVPANTPPPTAALVRSARSGDADALGALYDMYAASLYRTALRLTRSHVDAEDVVHDCFVGLPEALRHYNEQGKLDAWLRQIVVRLVLMRRRGEQRRREDSMAWTASVRDLPSTLRTDARAELNEVHRAIDALDERQRDVFVLKEIEGYSHAEIARLLSISEGASRVRLTRALNALRHTLRVHR